MFACLLAQPGLYLSHGHQLQGPTGCESEEAIARRTQNEKLQLNTIMNRIGSITILVIGVTLLVFGISAGDSFGSEVSELVNGAPSDKTIWLLVTGALATVVGGIGLVRRTSL